MFVSMAISFYPDHFSKVGIMPALSLEGLANRDKVYPTWILTV